jgi:hypothetical protein
MRLYQSGGTRGKPLFASAFPCLSEHIECADDPGGRNCFSDDAAFCGGFRRTGA